jgi:phage FluMu gp28-like protein
MSRRIITPKSLLLPYQTRWVDDAARFKAGIWSRQTGKDFSSGEEVVEDCIRRAKTTWLIAAPSERQSLESLEKCKEWTEAFKISIADALSENMDAHPQALLKSSTIVFPNKSRIVAVPGRPDTVRGYSANVLATEFAFFEDDEATWRALLPSITNPLRGGEKKVRVISTPNGKQGRFFKIIDENQLNPVPGRKMIWSCHKVTIHDAVAAGLPVDIEQIREGMDDPEGFSQEFECEFIDTSNVLLPYDIIALVESAEATEFCDPAFFNGSGSNPVYLGIDFGRTNDPTICWGNELIGDVEWTREVLALKGVSTPDQQKILSGRIRRATRVCFDYTGPGIGLGDLLVQEHGEFDPEKHKFGKIELCTFTAGFKREIFPKLRRAFEAPVRLRVPISKTVREDLHAMRQIVKNGEYSYSAPRTSEGHSDRCTALALAHRARGNGGVFAHAAVAIPGRNARQFSRRRLQFAGAFSKSA